MLENLFGLAAKVPPRLKTNTFYRLANYLFRRCDPKKLPPLTTNLGMSRKLRMKFPAITPSFFFFGSPKNYAGEVGALELCRYLTRTADAFVDIGANHGYFTFYVKTDPRNRNIPVYLYEPNLELLEEIESNIKASGLEGIRCYREAISDKKGTANFFVPNQDDLQSSLIQSPRLTVKETNIVPTIPFDEAAKGHGYKKAVVKVDVENAEFMFVEGAQKEIGRVEYLIIEVLADGHKQGFIPHAKKQFGMSAYYINHYTLHHSSAGEFTYRPPEYNWLLCRKTPRELASIVEPFGFTVI